MGNYGVKISVDGKDITSTEPRDYVLNSAYSSVKIAQSGPGSITVPAGSDATATIPHNLGFVPLVLFWTELNPGSGKWFSGAAKLTTPDADAGDVFINAGTDGNNNPTQSYADDTNLVIQYHNDNVSNKTVSYFYIIFGDNGI